MSERNPMPVTLKVFIKGIHLFSKIISLRNSK